MGCRFGPGNEATLMLAPAQVDARMGSERPLLGVEFVSRKFRFGLT